MKRAIDHDHFVAKNKSLAMAEDVNRRDDEKNKKAGEPRPEKRTCFNCKMKTGCSEFKARRTGRATGVVSFGGDESFVCDRHVPAPAQNRGMSAPQIKALMKNVMKGY
ncbi:MAG: hypothetical protein MUF22_02930 [Chitinispirillaceae bacterium]|jgi:hypothetical protein|nr:hypothetical protein [Chitinispirillaceae bacterium]